ncbi:MAG TPA: cupin domain-containing protein [Candidatus Limnocylindrales bacterium]|nr:cupin domain-containing protein [Candidatus Limnocylindrales bacterium]
MKDASKRHAEEQAERLSLYAVQALPTDEARAVEAHVATCDDCQRELGGLRTVVDSFVSWPTDVLRPSASLWDRLEQRLGAPDAATASPVQRWTAPQWKEVAPGISCKLLSTDADRHRVSMLVRLAPDTEYPPHRHADIEELHLLDGELWINDRQLFPGDFSRAEPGTSDRRVWSPTGCTCFLLTSTQDELS